MVSDMKHRLLVDTNALLDLVAKQRPEHQKAKELFAAAVGSEGIELLACVSSLKDVFYVYERHYGSVEGAWGVIEALCRVVEPVPLNPEMLSVALERIEPDFEDALIAACARCAGAGAVVSRDTTAFANGAVRKMTPAEALEAVSA